MKKIFVSLLISFTLFISCSVPVYVNKIDVKNYSSFEKVYRWTRESPSGLYYYKLEESNGFYTFYDLGVPNENDFNFKSVKEYKGAQVGAIESINDQISALTINGKTYKVKPSELK